MQINKYLNYTFADFLLFPAVFCCTTTSSSLYLYIKKIEAQLTIIKPPPAIPSGPGTLCIELCVLQALFVKTDAMIVKKPNGRLTNMY